MTRVAIGAMLSNVVTSLRRIAVVVLAAGLVAAAWRPCAGWEPTAEARMSCCVRKAHCAMHKAAGGKTGAPVRQADADACCAISEKQDSQQPSPTIVIAPALVPLVGLLAESPGSPIRWIDSRRPRPLLASRERPRHLLLSVFVI